MARGGGSQANSVGNCTGSSGDNGGNNGSNGNRFANLDNSSRSASDDSNSPFYLSNSDHCVLSLASYPLVGNNYNSWSCTMTVCTLTRKLNT